MAAIIAVSCLAVFVYICYIFLKPGSKRKLPPGPKGVPILGNVLQFGKKKMILDMAELGKQYGDAYTVKLFNKYVVILNSYDIMQEALCSPKYSALMSGRPPSFVRKYVVTDDEIWMTFSEEWLVLRRLAMRGLKTYGTSLKDVEELVQVELGHFIKRLQLVAGRPVDPRPYINGYITSILSMLITGKHLKHDDAELKRLTEVTDDIMYILTPGIHELLTTLPWLHYIPFGLGNVIQRLQRNVSSIMNTIAEERAKPRQSQRRYCFLDFILDEKDKGNLKEENVEGIMTNLLTAGTATSTTTLRMMFLFLAARPEIQKEIKEEVDRVIGRSRLPCAEDKNSLPFTQAFLWEFLRVYPAAPLPVPHCTMEDVHIRNFLLPKDILVFYNVWNVLHDEKFWEDPWEFKPSRFLDDDGKLVSPEDERRKRMIAFGLGKRACLGEVLARLRILLACTSVLQNFTLVPDPAKPLPDIDPRTFHVTSIVIAPEYNVVFMPRHSENV